MTAVYNKWLVTWQHNYSKSDARKISLLCQQVRRLICVRSVFVFSGM